MKLSDYIKKYGDNDVDEATLFELTSNNDINALQEIAVLKKKLSTLNDKFDSVDESVRNQVEFYYSRMMKIYRENHFFIIGLFVIFQVLNTIINMIF